MRDGHGTLLAIDPDKELHAASTMKVPVMIELFRQADAGRLSLDRFLSKYQSITGRNHSIKVRLDPD